MTRPIYVFSTEWASNILKGQKDDFSILKQNIDGGGSQNKDTQFSSGVSLLLGLSALETSSLIENKSIPFASSREKVPNVEITPIADDTPHLSTFCNKGSSRNPSVKRKAIRHDTTLYELQAFLSSIGDDRDYRSVLYSLLEKSYQENPYFVPIMKNELDSVRKTLHFMVEKEGKRWFCLYSNKQRIFCN